MTSKIDAVRTSQRFDLFNKILSEHNTAIIDINNQLMVLKGISLQGSVALGWHRRSIENLEKRKDDLLQRLEYDLREKAELIE